MGKGNKGIFIVRKSYVYEGMSMYWWCVFLWVMEGAWEAKEERGAVMAWGRPRWSSVPVLFGGSIVNNPLSLGAEPTNVVRQDGLIEWKSDGYIEVGGVQVWAYYYFEDGEDVDRCDWADHMEIEVEECWI